MNNFIKCPLNYTGGKYRLLSQIYPLFPQEGGLAIDLFSGGANVGVNLVNFDEIKCIDSNERLVNLLKLLKNEKELVSKIENIINNFGLSNSSKYGCKYYNIKGNKGFSRINKEAYLKLRKTYNHITVSSGRKNLLLLVLIIYGFNSQIRFNQKGEFNIPVGKSDFNSTRKRNIIKFYNRCKKLNIKFISKNFRDFPNKNLKNVDFIYCDPPYLISTATYNENNGWTKSDEKDLLNFLDKIDQRNIKFALSNILYSNKKENKILLNWSKRYNIHKLNYNYSNSNYQKKGGGEQEVLITNY